MKVVLLALVAVALVLAACGESKEDKAMKSVCNARADISKQIDQLKNLSGDRKAQVQKATEQFSSQVKDITSQAVKSLSLSDAQAQLTSALQQLVTAYQQTLKPIDCS